MNIEEIRNYCIQKADTTEGLPFGEGVLVFKVLGKIFALINLEGALRLSLKCDPQMAIELRESFENVIPGYHLNKQHWNTIYIDNSIPDNLILEWIDNSYNLIRASLKKR